MLLSSVVVWILVWGQVSCRLSLSTCNIECQDGGMGVGTSGEINRGPVGKHGPKGEKGDTGLSCDCPDKRIIVNEIRSTLNNQPGTWSNPVSSCKQLVDEKGIKNGIYIIRDQWGDTYPTYCDFTTDGGGWTLVMSIHENFMQGHCTLGDRWSSEHGNNASHPHGDGNWQNFKSFGRATSATSDDFKSPAYWTLNVCDIMVWHVPNDTPMPNYEPQAFMKYHTTDCAWRSYKNLRNFFANHFPIKNKQFTMADNGPSFPVTWNRGSDDVMVENTAPNARSDIDPGFIQFRVLNNEGGCFAFCPVRIKPNKGNVETVCYGSTSYFTGHANIHRYCGDFGVRDWNGYATGNQWSSNKLMSESVVMIFYR